MHVIPHHNKTKTVLLMQYAIVVIRVCFIRVSALPMLRLLSSKVQGLKKIENQLYPVILVFIGELLLSTLRWVPILSRVSIISIRFFATFCICQIIHQLHNG